MKKFGMTCCLFAFSFLLGYGIIMHTSDWGPIARDPAAIRQIYDFSNLTGSDLTQAMKKRILAGANIVREKQSLGVELGHFALASATGGKILACQEFEKVHLRFEAEGIAIGGDRPVMEIEGNCEYSSDMTKINPIFIPVDKITAERPADGDIQFRDGNSPVSVHLQGMPDEWPTRWLLTSVRLSNKTTQKEFLIDANEMADILGHPMMVNLK